MLKDLFWSKLDHCLYPDLPYGIENEIFEIFRLNDKEKLYGLRKVVYIIFLVANYILKKEPLGFFKLFSYIIYYAFESG